MRSVPDARFLISVILGMRTCIKDNLSLLKTDIKYNDQPKFQKSENKDATVASAA